MVCLTHRAILDGGISSYHLLDWRSFRLPRVARSTLAAEGQAAAEAADCLHFVITFWKALLDPGYKINSDEQCFRWKNESLLVIDAKCLYDILHREELYVSSTADKRTCLEALVTRDKLKEIGGSVRWVSSERQYADGLTKESATQLLADRLRTHQHKITADESYQASRKKDAGERARSANQFARPKAAASAIATTAFFATPTAATRTEDMTALILYRLTDEVTYYETGAYVFAILLVTMVLIYWHPWTKWTFPRFPRTAPCLTEATTQTGNPSTSNGAQTDATYLVQPFPEMRTFRHRGIQTDNLSRTSRHSSIETVLLELATVRDQNNRLAAAVRQQQHLIDYHTSNRLSHHHVGDIYVTPHGRVWHTSDVCAQSRTENRVQTRAPCSYCTDTWIPVPEHLTYNPNFRLRRVPDQDPAASSSATTTSGEHTFAVLGETGSS